jgi:UbiD family decarboxylase
MNEENRMDLHTFLEELERKEPEKLLRVKKPINTKYEVTALQYALAEKGTHPVILCERPIKADGEISQFPLVVNLTASRELCCKLLGISDPRRAAIDYAQRLSQKGKVRVVSKSEAPVKEVIERGAEVNLFRFPHTIQHEMNVGIYITAGFVTTYDPDTGIDNTALQRCWVKARNRTGLVPSPTTHNLNNIQKFMARKEDTPVAVWIGHHPAGIMGGQSKLGYPVSHYPSMAGALGEELRLVPTETFGEKILVPANAEIVIEGYVPCGVFEAEGPFAEYTGYVGPQIPAPVIEVACVTYRRNAIYQDYALGLPDMLVLDNMAMGLRHKSGVNHWARDSQ